MVMQKSLLIVTLLILALPVIHAELYYYHQDHLGGTALVTDESGNIISGFDYEPFGEQLYEIGEETFSYNSKEFDDSGLFYYGARYYDPDNGRFLSADTVKGKRTDPQSLNRYVYVKNNPINFVDPMGNDAYADEEMEKINSDPGTRFAYGSAEKLAPFEEQTEEIGDVMAETVEVANVVAEVAVSIVSEPVDYAMTVTSVAKGESSPIFLAVMLAPGSTKAFAVAADATGYFSKRAEDLSDFANKDAWIARNEVEGLKEEFAKQGEKYHITNPVRGPESHFGGITGPTQSHLNVNSLTSQGHVRKMHLLITENPYDSRLLTRSVGYEQIK